MNMHHALKLQQPYFDHKLRGVKPWEIRATDDRHFTTGDTVTFHEWHPVQGDTGRTIGPCTIIYILCGTGLLPNGAVIFTHTEVEEPTSNTERTASCR